MAYELSSSVKYVKPILGFYTEGPWTSLVEANANIDPAIRVQGMACKIIIAGVAHIYWYRDGVLDADLVEFMGGSSFDPENITTNLVFNPSFDRNINRIRVDGLTTYLQEIILSDIGTILTNVQIDPSGFRRARLEANAIGGFTLSYTSPEGNNQVVILPDKTELSKVGRYISSPTLSNDLDIPHKKYVDDLSNSKQDRLAGIVSGCEITVETFSGTPVATNKQIKVSKGLALTNSWYIPTSEYSKLADTISSEITLCPTGGDFKYYDIVADNTNAITIHEGTPSTSPVHYVIDPATQVLLGFITVGDAVIEEPVVTPSSRIYSTFFPELITTTNQSLSVQTIQGLDRLNALFLNQTDPLDNGFYGWNGAVWVKFSFPMGFWDTETDFLYNTLFIAQEGDYANQAFVFNNYIGNRSSRNISGGDLTQASQAQVEAAFDNTDQTTPVVLEQTSALTPFNAWWLVQKIKTWVGSKYLDQSGSKLFSLTATSTTAFTGTLTPAILAYSQGLTISLKLHATPTGLVTLNINGIGAKKWYKDPSTQIGVGDVSIGNSYIVIYDDALDGGVGGFITTMNVATTVVYGTVQLDTDANVIANANPTRVVNSGNLAAWWTDAKTKAQTFLAQINFSGLAVFGNSIEFTNTQAVGTGDGFYRPSTNVLGVKINGVEVARWDSTNYTLTVGLSISGNIFDLTINPTVATGNANVNINPNLANALNFKDTSANDYLRFISTTGNLKLQALQQLEITKSLKQSAISIVSDITLDLNHRIIYVDATSNDVTITLPNPTVAIYQQIEYAIKRIDSSAFVVTIQTNVGTVFIDGGVLTSLALTSLQSKVIRNRNATQWQSW